ncbi:MAG: iron-containing alcohol dehydrogenase [Spirochaetaceae bacterium]|nr:MAG: iron-containing alcohol dehydrogenase [Spirochaetaceae bacterium]
MENFEHYNPDRILFGPGERKRVGSELKKRGFKRALIVVAKGPFRENGLYDEIAGSIKAEGIDIYNIGDIDSNPRITSVREGVETCKKNSIECVVALGGGSTMDSTKVIAAASRSEDDPWEHLWGHKKPFNDSLDTVMIPTLAATGTDINPWAVIMDKEAIWKMPVTAECMYPDLTIADPEIHATVPIRLTIWGAMDMLSHTFEFYFNGYHRSIFQNRFSEAIIHSVTECVDILVKNPKDLRARGEIWWSSVMAWGGLTFLGRGGPDMACHDMAEGFVPFYDTHHGATLGVITPRWMRFVVNKNPKSTEIFSRFARNVLGIQAVDDRKAAIQGVEQYIQWLQAIGAPKTLQELTGVDIPEGKLKEITAKTFKDLGRPVGNLVGLSQEDVVEILKSCCQPLS